MSAETKIPNIDLASMDRKIFYIGALPTVAEVENAFHLTSANTFNRIASILSQYEREQLQSYFDRTEKLVGLTAEFRLLRTSVRYHIIDSMLFALVEALSLVLLFTGNVSKLDMAIITTWNSMRFIWSTYLNELYDYRRFRLKLKRCKVASDTTLKSVEKLIRFRMNLMNYIGKRYTGRVPLQWVNAMKSLQMDMHDYVTQLKTQADGNG